MASAEPGNNGLGMLRSAAVVVDVVTVSVVEAVPPEGVTVDGEKLHEAPEGNPEQLKETAELKPLRGETVREVVPLCPAVTVNDAGEAAMEKSGTGRLMVYVAVDTPL